jgi:hypothetical protein
VKFDLMICMKRNVWIFTIGLMICCTSAKNICAPEFVDNYKLRPTDSATCPQTIERNWPAFQKYISEGVSAFADFNLLIDKDGNVQEAKLIKTDHDEIAKLVSNAALKWKFRPATLKGVPVAAYWKLFFRLPRLKK